MRPIQTISVDEYGVTRFEENKIVRFLLESANRLNINMNTLATMDFSQEDMEQFAQLIGYSISGFGDLSYVSNATFETAHKMAESGKSETEARIEYLEETLATVRDGMKDTVIALFRIHPDDLVD